MADGATLAKINTRLSDHIVSINGKMEFQRKFVLNKLVEQ